MINKRGLSKAVGTSLVPSRVMSVLVQNRKEAYQIMIDGRPTTEQDPSPWMTVVQVAEYLSVSPGTVRNWVSQRYIPFARRGRVVRFHRDKIDQWLSAGASRGRRAVPARHSCLS